MSLNRALVVVGSIVAAVGGGGLTVFGSAPAEVFEILLVRVAGEGADPLPAALGKFPPAAFCAALLGVGVLAVCAGLGLHGRQHSITPTGRILAVIGGLGVLVAAIPIAVGLLGTRAMFFQIAMASTLPRPEELQAAMDLNRPLLTIGYWVLLIAFAFPLLAGIVGFQRRPSERRMPLVPLLPAIIAGMSGFCYFGMFLLNWQHAAALESVFANVEAVPKPAELAGHLNSILTISIAGCALLIVMGVAVAMGGLLAPRAEED